MQWRIVREIFFMRLLMELPKYSLDIWCPKYMIYTFAEPDAAQDHSGRFYGEALPVFMSGGYAITDV